MDVGACQCVRLRAGQSTELRHRLSSHASPDVTRDSSEVRGQTDRRDIDRAECYTVSSLDSTHPFIRCSDRVGCINSRIAKEGYGVRKCSFPKPPRAPLSFEQKVSRQVLSPTTGFPSPPHSTRSPQMCFVSRAIAPRLPWLESHLGHWYWDVPSYAHRYCT